MAMCNCPAHTGTWTVENLLGRCCEVVRQIDVVAHIASHICADEPTEQFFPAAEFRSFWPAVPEPCAHLPGDGRPIAPQDGRKVVPGATRRPRPSIWASRVRIICSNVVGSRWSLSWLEVESTSVDHRCRDVQFHGLQFTHLVLHGMHLDSGPSRWRAGLAGAASSLVRFGVGSRHRRPRSRRRRSGVPGYSHVFGSVLCCTTASAPRRRCNVTV